jgi:hypothetical protein
MEAGAGSVIEIGGRWLVLEVLVLVRISLCMLSMICYDVLDLIFFEPDTDNPLCT